MTPLTQFYYFVTVIITIIFACIALGLFISQWIIYYRVWWNFKVFKRDKRGLRR